MHAVRECNIQGRRSHGYINVLFYFTNAIVRRAFVSSSLPNCMKRIIGALRVATGLHY